MKECSVLDKSACFCSHRIGKMEGMAPEKPGDPKVPGSSRGRQIMNPYKYVFEMSLDFGHLAFYKKIRAGDMRSERVLGSRHVRIMFRTKFKQCNSSRICASDN